MQECKMAQLCQFGIKPTRGCFPTIIPVGATKITPRNLVTMNCLTAPMGPTQRQTTTNGVPVVFNAPVNDPSVRYPGVYVEWTSNLTVSVPLLATVQVNAFPFGSLFPLPPVAINYQYIFQPHQGAGGAIFLLHGTAQDGIINTPAQLKADQTDGVTTLNNGSTITVTPQFAAGMDFAIELLGYDSTFLAGLLRRASVQPAQVLPLLGAGGSNGGTFPNGNGSSYPDSLADGGVYDEDRPQKTAAVVKRYLRARRFYKAFALG